MDSNNFRLLPPDERNAMSSQVFREKSIKLPGLVTQDYCILASISHTSSRTGTVWTDKDSNDYTVISKNHHRVSNEKSVISIKLSPGNAELSAETTATAMFEIISVEDRYEITNRVAYKDYSSVAENHWRAVVYGGAGLGDDTQKILIDPLIDPYVDLTAHQFYLSARVNDVVKDPQAARIIEKRYRELGSNMYANSAETADFNYINIQSFTHDDMFRTLAAGDTYEERFQNGPLWTVKEKRVFYIDNKDGVDLYGREILLISNT
jgi:hypothetical protein